MGGTVQGRIAWINVLAGSDRAVVDGLRGFMACIDTGATATTIKDDYAQAMGLIPLRETKVSTVNGTVTLTVYAMSILVIGNQQSMQLREVIEVVGAKDLVVDMLYGMDMLSGGQFAMQLDAHGNGSWSWSMTPTPPPAAQSVSPEPEPPPGAE